MKKIVGRAATAARVRLDGQDLRDVRGSSLRRHMGVVLQDTFLFTGTIKDNIRYGRPDATDEEIVAAAKTVGADVFIRRFPEGYETQVRERGGRLRPRSAREPQAPRPRRGDEQRGSRR